MDEFVAKRDPLEIQRQNDLIYLKNYLFSHSSYGDFFKKYWSSIQRHIRLENYHKDVFFVKHDEITRKVYLLISGVVSAYVISDDLKLTSVHEFKANELISELAALFNSPWHYGLHAVEDCAVVAIDLVAIENIETDTQMYSELIDLLYTETGELCTDIFNHMLKNKIDLNDLLGKHNLFASLTELGAKELANLTESMKYIFVSKNQLLLEPANKQHLYIIESGSVEQTKTYLTATQGLAYIEDSNLSKVDIVYANNKIVRDFDSLKNVTRYKHAYYDFKRQLKNADLESMSQDMAKKVTITEEVYRYGTIGEENLNKFSSIELTAKTLSPCCLLEINIVELVPKDSVFAQVLGFFNNRVNNLEYKLAKFKALNIRSSHEYLTYLNLSFFIILATAVIGLLSRFNNYLNASFTLNSDVLLVYHVILAVIAGVFIAYAIKNFDVHLDYFGLHTKNLSKHMMDVGFMSIMLILIVPLLTVGIKLVSNYFNLVLPPDPLFKIALIPDIIAINRNIHLVASLGLVYCIYLVYIIIYEFCVRGIVQNLFLKTLNGSENFVFWVSVFAASCIGMQFNLTMFQEFSLITFIADLAIGGIFARTRNLYAAIALHLIFVFYIIIFNLPGIYS